MMFKSKLSFFYAEQRARRDNAPIPVRIRFGQPIPPEIVRLAAKLNAPTYDSRAWTGRK